MLGVGVSLWHKAVPGIGVGGSPFANYSLAFPFATAETDGYWVDGVSYAALSSVPGYVYTRTGAKGEIDATGGIDSFATDVPGIVPGVGYWSRQQLTNEITYSNALENWATNGNSAANTASPAPDGTNTARTITANNANTSSTIYTNAPGVSGTATFSGFFRADTNSNYAYFTDGGTYAVWFDLINGVVGTIIGTVSTNIFPAADGFYRCVAVGAIGTFPQVGQSRSDSAYDQQIGDKIRGWGAQTINGNIPDGGPIIATAGATATVNADALSVSLANGNYSVVYTFADDTTDTVPTTIADGSYEVPTTYSKAIKLITAETV